MKKKEKTGFQRFLREKWISAPIAVVIVIFFSKYYFPSVFGVPVDRFRIFSLPMVLVFLSSYFVFIGGFSGFKIGRIGIYVFFVFTILNSIVMGFLLQCGFVPMPKTGDAWYDLLIVTSFFIFDLMLVVLFLKIFSRKKGKAN